MSYVNGPVPLRSMLYVNRQFDDDLFDYVTNREWVLILGPRQHGKTSALKRLRNKIIDLGFECAFVDMQKLPPNLDFNGVLAWFARALATSLGINLHTEFQGAPDSFEDWLHWAAGEGTAPIVVVIDEASAISDDAIRNAFYGQIRAIKSAATDAPEHSVLTRTQFIFAGTFRPESLVDERNSPFNVCRRIDTEDFDQNRVSEVSAIALDKAVEEVYDISRLIYEKVGGQPHLVQSLLAAAERADESFEMQAVADEALRMAEHGTDHLSAIFRVVVQEEALKRIVMAVIAQGQIPYDPANVDVKFVMTVGLLKRAGASLIFRNALYEQVARASAQLQAAPNANGAQLILYPLEVSRFGFITDPEYREICSAAYNGAIAAANNGSHRLAISGFGVAMEAMLQDWLIAQPPAIVAAAVARGVGQARPGFSNYEDQNNPATWRLVNLMKVGRLMNRILGPLDLPDCMRELRNWVHPHLIKQNYLPEPDVSPEVKACVGILEMIMRELQR